MSRVGPEASVGRSYPRDRLAAASGAGAAGEVRSTRQVRSTRYAAFTMGRPWPAPA